MLSLASGESTQRAVSHDCCGSSTALCNRLNGAHLVCYRLGWVLLGLGLASSVMNVELPAQSVVCRKHCPILTLGLGRSFGTGCFYTGQGLPWWYWTLIYMIVP